MMNDGVIKNTNLGAKFAICSLITYFTHQRTRIFYGLNRDFKKWLSTCWFKTSNL